MLADHALGEAEMLEEHLGSAEEKHQSAIRGMMKDALDRHDGYHQKMKEHRAEPSCEVGKMYRQMLHDDHLERKAKLRTVLEGSK